MKFGLDDSDYDDDSDRDAHFPDHVIAATRERHRGMQTTTTIVEWSKLKSNASEVASPTPTHRLGVRGSPELRRQDLMTASREMNAADDGSTLPFQSRSHALLSPAVLRSRPLLAGHDSLRVRSASPSMDCLVRDKMDMEGPPGDGLVTSQNADTLPAHRHRTLSDGSAFPVKDIAARLENRLKNSPHRSAARDQQLLQEETEACLARLHALWDAYSRQKAAEYKQEAQIKTDRLLSEVETRQLSQNRILAATLREAAERERALQELERQELANQEADRLRVKQQNEAALELAKQKAKADRIVAEAKQRKQQASVAKSAPTSQPPVKGQETKDPPVESSSLDRSSESEALSEADVYINKLVQVKTKIQGPLRCDKGLWQRALQARMQFTTKIGAVTNSCHHIQEFYVALDDVLRSARIQSPQLYDWLQNSFAKHVVKQAESEVAVNFKKALPVACLLALLTTTGGHETLMDYVLGRLYKKCPCLIPIPIRRLRPDEPDKEVRKRMGYKKVDAVHFETEAQWQERMCGMVALFVAITQLDLSATGLVGPFVQVKSIPRVKGLLWRWLARLLNARPQRISLLALETFLKVGGHAFVKQYGTQADKVMTYIRRQFLERAVAHSPVAADSGIQVRLELALERYRFLSYPKLEGFELRP